MCLFLVQSRAFVLTCVCVCLCWCDAAVIAAGGGSLGDSAAAVDAHVDVAPLVKCNKRGKCKTKGKSFYVTDLKFSLINYGEVDIKRQRAFHWMQVSYLLCETWCYFTYVCMYLYQVYLRYMYVLYIREYIFLWFVFPLSFQQLIANYFEVKNIYAKNKICTLNCLYFVN